MDGTVECFTQGHLPLALFSILALVLEAGLIPLVVMISMEKLKVSVFTIYGHCIAHLEYWHCMRLYQYTV